MIIENAILHIFDFTSDTKLLSDTTIDLSDVAVYDYLTKQLKNCLNSTNAKHAKLNYNSSFANIYQDEHFVESSKDIASEIYRLLSMSNSRNPFDLLVVRYTESEVAFLALIFLKHKPAFTRIVEQSDLGFAIKMINHSSIFIGANQKIDNFAIVNLVSGGLSIQESTIDINAEETALFAKNLFNCDKVNEPTKEVLKKVNQVVEEVAKAYDENPTIALTRTKNYLNEKLEVDSEIKALEISNEVFPDSTKMQEKFETLIKDYAIPEEIKVDKKIVSKVIKNQKIKTDTGIEITFPSEYSENHDFIEFINNPDGTISIQIKNIAKILNK